MFINLCRQHESSTTAYRSLYAFSSTGWRAGSGSGVVCCQAKDTYEARADQIRKWAVWVSFGSSVAGLGCQCTAGCLCSVLMSWEGQAVNGAGSSDVLYVNFVGAASTSH